MQKATSFRSIDDYIASYPAAVQAVLKKMRSTIARAVPEAEEVISYQMPAFRLRKVLIFFSAWKSHYSLFVPSGATLQAFKIRLSKFEVHKATVKIPLSGPIPYALIAALAKRRAEEESGKGKASAKAMTKKKAKTKTKTVAASKSKPGKRALKSQRKET